MEEDSSAELLNADYLRIFLDNYQHVKPYIQKFSGTKDDEDEKKKP